MNTHQELIRHFYTSFQKLDYRGMQSCYHDQVEFSDPVFQQLKGTEAGKMWQMLVSGAKDLVITFNSIEANEHTGKCHWEAFYTFSLTGKKVHNRIDAIFTFQDGKIIQHQDVFDFWRWSRMALGTTGILLGWTPMVQNKVRKRARQNLDKFINQGN